MVCTYPVLRRKLEVAVIVVAPKLTGGPRPTNCPTTPQPVEAVAAGTAKLFQASTLNGRVGAGSPVIDQAGLRLADACAVVLDEGVSDSDLRDDHRHGGARAIARSDPAAARADTPRR